MELQAYAKINLYLDVVAKRDDGYHDIISIMQSVDLCDLVSVVCHEQEPGEIALTCDGGLPCDARNLAYRAAHVYFAGQVPCRIEITVQKRIPAEAGLAGGSADCAAVLRALNQIFGKYLINIGALALSVWGIYAVISTGNCAFIKVDVIVSQGVNEIFLSAFYFTFGVGIFNSEEENAFALVS